MKPRIGLVAQPNDLAVLVVVLHFANASDLVDAQICWSEKSITRLPWHRAHIIPSARSASRCRSSDWESSAFETRAPPIRMCPKRSFGTYRDPTQRWRARAAG